MDYMSNPLRVRLSICFVYLVYEVFFRGVQEMAGPIISAIDAK